VHRAHTPPPPPARTATPTCQPLPAHAVCPIRWTTPSGYGWYVRPRPRLVRLAIMGVGGPLRVDTGKKVCVSVCVCGGGAGAACRGGRNTGGRPELRDSQQPGGAMRPQELEPRPAAPHQGHGAEEVQGPGVRQHRGGQRGGGCVGEGGGRGCAPLVLLATLHLELSRLRAHPPWVCRAGACTTPSPPPVLPIGHEGGTVREHVELDFVRCPPHPTPPPPPPPPPPPARAQGLSSTAAAAWCRGTTTWCPTATGGCGPPLASPTHAEQVFVPHKT
jgi:hypothetical protein